MSYYHFNFSKQLWYREFHNFAIFEVESLILNTILVPENFIDCYKILFLKLVNASEIENINDTKYFKNSSANNMRKIDKTLIICDVKYKTK